MRDIGSDVKLSDIYTHEAHHLLAFWAGWARGNQLIRQPMNILAKLMQKKLDEESGGGGYRDDPSDFTAEIEAIDKAVAKLREDDPQLRRFVMQFYLRGYGHFEIASGMRVSESLVRSIHMRALTQTLRHARVIYDNLTNGKDRRI